MGTAKDSAGSLLIQCQSCHGSMSAVGAANRVGWRGLPSCDGCHYPANGSYVRDVSVFDSSGAVRAPGGIFTPGSRLLYKLAATHGVQCEACHGSTHAEYASSEANDNVQSIALQGYAGKIVECTVCHVNVPLTKDGGPHGIHTIGQTWVSRHGDFAERSVTSCSTCHGSDYRGTFLSKTSTARTFTIDDGRTSTFSAGHMVSCYDCHNGPGGGG